MHGFQSPVLIRRMEAHGLVKFVPEFCRQAAYPLCFLIHAADRVGRTHQRDCFDCHPATVILLPG